MACVGNVCSGRHSSSRNVDCAGGWQNPPISSHLNQQVPDTHTIAVPWHILYHCPEQAVHTGQQVDKLVVMMYVVIIVYVVVDEVVVVVAVAVIVVAVVVVVVMVHLKFTDIHIYIYMCTTPTEL